MVEVLFSWFWLGISAFLWGFAILKFIKKISGYEKSECDIVIMLGLCFLTVYAQIFSLFYKVGMAASALLLAINIAIFLFMRKEIITQVTQWLSIPKIYGKAVILALFTGFILMISATDICHYDTYLYHAQSIRWIEEYGIVPGIGNLHNRLAYNSALFPLQALFSLKFLVGRSLHSVNGFVVVLLGGYALNTLKVFTEKKLFISDFLRLAVLIVLFDKQNCNIISSPGSDILALGLVVYILTKWVTYWEEEEKEIAPYVVLCLLGVYAVSVKLSAAMIVLFALLPAINLIMQKRWKQIAVYIALGIVIIAPFLARNVVISGYLVYPYPELDLFKVDWKMPEYTLLFDRNEIKAWGWGLNDVYRFNAPITEWFPVWIKKLGSIMQKMFYLNVMMLIPSVVWGIRNGIAKKDWNFLLIISTIICCMALWFLGSPLPRYGSVFLILLPLFMLGKIIRCIQKDKTLGRGACGVVVICILLCMKSPIDYVSVNEFTELKSPDYDSREAYETTLGGETIYYPVEGDLIGYYKFPSTPYVARLQLIELRGEDIAEGFRMKEEYRDAFVATYGQVHGENIFEVD